MALFRWVQYLCTFNIVTSLIYHLLPNVWKASYTISMSIFVDVPYWLPYSMDKFISCVVPVLHRGSCSTTFVQCSDYDTWNRTPPLFTTMLGVTSLLLLSTSCNGRFWNSHHTHPIWVHVRSLRQRVRTAERDPIQHKRWTYLYYRAVYTENQQRWTHWCMIPSKHLAKCDK